MNNKDVLHTRYADLFDDNKTIDPALEKLITDLETVYMSTSRPAQLPEMLISTLEAHMQQNDTATVPVPLFPEQAYAHSPFKRRLKSLHRGLTIAAAVLLTALITGSLLLVLQGARNSTQTGSGGQVVTGFSRFISIHMVNDTTGWAQASNSLISTLGILRTTDGGIHWQDVTPPQLTKPVDDNLGILYSLDANTAWITDVFPLQQQPAHPQNVLFRTTDAGKTWQQMTMPQSVAGAYGNQVTFLNTQTGWIVGSDNKKPQLQEELWQTNDGGQTWNKVNTTFPGTSQTSLGYKDITFVTEKIWWLTGTYIDNNGKPTVYVTRDAGLTWQQQRLQVPSGFSFTNTNETKQPQSISVNGSTFTSLNAEEIVKINQPQFFLANDGILTLQSNSETLIYTTHDGGNTWQATGSLKAQANDSAPSAAFTDINHGLAYEQLTSSSKESQSQTNLLVYTTTDGGQHWTVAHTQLPLPKGMQDANLLLFNARNPDFVSAQTGWLIEAVRVPGANLPQTDLLHTVDGGLTWTIVNYSVYQN